MSRGIAVCQIFVKSLFHTLFFTIFWHFIFKNPPLPSYTSNEEGSNKTNWNMHTWERVEFIGLYGTPYFYCAERNCSMCVVVRGVSNGWLYYYIQKDKKCVKYFLPTTYVDFYSSIHFLKQPNFFPCVCACVLKKNCAFVTFFVCANIMGDECKRRGASPPPSNNNSPRQRGVY